MKVVFLILVVSLALSLALSLVLTSGFVSAQPQSACFGTTAKGRLEDGVQLPSEGKNFESYSKIAQALGRTYVHSKTADIMLGAYKHLETIAPGKVFKYADYLKTNITFSKRPSWVRHDEHYHVDFDIACQAF